jgi:hypothetical protein
LRDNVAALDQADAAPAVDPGDPPQDLLDPGAGGIDHGAGADDQALAGRAADELRLPAAVDPAGTDALRAG